MAFFAGYCFGVREMGFKDIKEQLALGKMATEMLATGKVGNNRFWVFCFNVLASVLLVIVLCFLFAGIGAGIAATVFGGVFLQLFQVDKAWRRIANA